MNRRELKKLIYEVRIELKHVKPLVWRCIQIRGDQTFWGLHMAIQDVMGWEDYHLHEFNLPSLRDGRKVRIGIPDPVAMYPEDEDLKASWEENVADYLTMDNGVADYTYDFGDDWEHKVKVQKIIPAIPNRKYPRCIGGEMACPPEDVGGPRGYETYLQALANPMHPQHEEYVEWRGSSFDPTNFDPMDVSFDNSKERWKIAFASQEL